MTYGQSPVAFAGDCFERLPVPWRKASDLGEGAYGAHLEENFRLLDQWANPLELDPDCVGDGSVTVARGRAFPFSGTVAAADTDYFDGDQYGVGTPPLDGGMTWDAGGVATSFVAPRTGFYLGSMNLLIDCTPVTEPYWIQLVCNGAAHILPIPDAAGFLPFTISYTRRIAAGANTNFGLFNNVTASVDLDYLSAIINLVEIPNSSLS